MIFYSLLIKKNASLRTVHNALYITHCNLRLLSKTNTYIIWLIAILQLILPSDRKRAFQLF